VRGSARSGAASRCAWECSVAHPMNLPENAELGARTLASRYSPLTLGAEGLSQIASISVSKPQSLAAFIHVPVARSSGRLAPKPLAWSRLNDLEAIPADA